MRMETFEVTAAGWVRNDVKEPVDDIWGNVRSRIELEAARFTAESLTGLDSFSHVEVIYYLNRVAEENIIWGARHPRNRKSWPVVGIFAQRAKNRPNRLAVSVCRVLKVDGMSLLVEGLDAIDGTPVLDLKPYIREFGPRGEVYQPSWATDLMAGYWGS